MKFSEMTGNIAYLAVRAGLLALSAVPLKVKRLNARFLAFLIGKVFRYRRNDVIINLARCFPLKTYDEINDICDRFYLHFADVFSEAVWFGGSSPERLRKSALVKIANPEVPGRLYENSPSVVVLTSHCGNWELFGGLANYNYSDVPDHIDESNVVVVYRKLSSKLWNRIMGKNRLAPLDDPEGFEGYVETEDIIRYVYRNKDKKKFYFGITDQRPYVSSPKDVVVNFFYDIVATMSGFAAVAHKFHMAVTYMKFRCPERGHYTMEFIPVCEDASKMSVQEIMDRYYRMLEDEIREQPENYLWTHHRWLKWGPVVPVEHIDHE